MSMLQVLVAAGPKVYYEPFQTPWDYPDATDLDDATDLFTRQYPATDQNNIEYRSSTTRAQMTANGGTARFSWDEPGETTDDFVYRAIFVGNSASDYSWEMIFCWTPDSAKAHAGDCYTLKWDGPTGNLVIQERATGSATSLTTQSFTMSTGYSYNAEVSFTRSSGTISCKVWRTIDSKPSTATISTTDSTLEGGKVGFYMYKGTSASGLWIDDLWIEH